MTRVITFVLLAGALCAPSVLPSSAYADGGQAGPGADPQALEDTHFFPDFELGPIMVSGWNFKTLQEAVDAIGSDSEVKGRTAVLIEDNVEESITVPAGKELSIDLYAHRLSGTAGKPAITVKSGAKLTIEGSVADSAVLFAPTPGAPALVIEPGASVVMESGSVKGAEGVTTPVIQNGGTFVAHDGVRVEGEVLGGMDVHKHALSFVPEVPATCMVDGRPEYWHCDGCGLSFADPEGRNMIRPSEQVILHPGHLVKHVPAVEPTAQAEGNAEYWECDRCGLVFADAGLAQAIEKTDTVLPKLEAPAPAVPMQPTFPAAQQVVLAPLSLLPKTGDESAIPVVIMGVIGAIAVVTGIVVKMRGKLK